MLDHLRLPVPVLSNKESSETSDVWRCLAGSNETAQTVARGARRKSRRARGQPCQAGLAAEAPNPGSHVGQIRARAPGPSITWHQVLSVCCRNGVTAWGSNTDGRPAEVRVKGGKISVAGERLGSHRGNADHVRRVAECGLDISIVLEIRTGVSCRDYDQHPLLLGVVEHLVDRADETAIACLGESAAKTHVGDIGSVISRPEDTAEDL